MPATLANTFLFIFPRNAMHSADYAVTRCLSVCLSHVGILSKRLNIYGNLFYRRHSSFVVPNDMAIFRRESICGLFT